MDELNAKTLKEVLWDTLQKLREDKIDVGTADAIAQQSREIVRVARTQQSICSQAKESLPQELVDFAK